MADELSSSRELILEISELNRLMRESRSRVQGGSGTTSDFQLLRGLEAEERIRKELELNSFRKDAFNRLPAPPPPQNRLFELRAERERAEQELQEVQRQIGNLQATGDLVPFDLSQREQRIKDRIGRNTLDQKEQEYQIANPDQSRNRERDRLQAEEDALNLRLLEAEAKRRDQALRIREQARRAKIKSEEDAAAAVETIVRRNQINLSEIEARRLTQIEEGLRSGVLSEDDAARERLSTQSAQIQQAIALEQDKINRLSALRFTEKESAIANDLEIAESRRNTVQLNLDLVRSLRQEELNLEREAIEAIADRGEAATNAHNARLSELSEYSNAVQLLNGVFERQKALLDSESDLLGARDALTGSGINIELDNLERALQVRKELNDETLDPGVRAALTAELEALAGDPNATEGDLIGQQLARERELQEVKRRSLAFDQEAARQRLELTARQNEFEAQRLVIESESARIEALRDVDESRNALEQLQADSTADPQDLANAQASLASAQSRQRLAEANANNAVQSLLGQERLSGLESLALSQKQDREIIEFEAADIRAEQRRNLTIAQAKARGVNVEESQLSPVDIQSLLDRNQQLLSQQLVPGAPTGALGIDNSSAFRELLNLNRQQLTATQDLSTTMLRLVNRPAQVNNVRVLNGTPLDDVLQDQGV